MTVDDFEILKLLRELTEKESDRFWTRNNVFVGINAGLLAFLAASYDEVPTFVFLGMCGFGIATSLAWYQISRAGKYYAQRWRLAARSLAASDDELAKKAPLLAGVKNLDKPRGPSSSQCMMAMALVAATIWFALAGFGIAARTRQPSAVGTHPATLSCVIIGERNPH